jgi:hypothetical protein
MFHQTPEYGSECKKIEGHLIVYLSRRYDNQPCCQMSIDSMPSNAVTENLAPRTKRRSPSSRKPGRKKSTQSQEHQQLEGASNYDVMTARDGYVTNSVEIVDHLSGRKYILFLCWFCFSATVP